MKEEVRRRGLAVFLSKLFLVLLGIILTTSFTGSALSAEVKTVKVGLLLPLTGPMSTLGELNKRGFELAIEKLNREGGIKSLGGARLEFITADSESDPKVAASETEKLITLHKVPIITGSYASALAFTASAIAERHKTPFWEVSGTADNLTERGFKYFFRTMLNATHFAGTAVHFLNALGYKNIGIVTEDSLAGEAANKVFDKLANEYGMQVVVNVKHPHDVTSLTSEILKIKSTNPKALAVAQYTTDSILFVKQMKELDLNIDVFAGTMGGPPDPHFRKVLGEAANYMCGATSYNWDVKTLGSEEFLKAYLNRYKENPTTHPSYCYMGMLALADVLERAGSLDADKIVDAALRTDTKETINSYGIKFDPRTHHNIRATYGMMVQWQQGELYTVWPEKFASKKPLYPMRKWKDRK